MLSRIDRRFLSSQVTSRRSFFIILILTVALYFIAQCNWDDYNLPETEHSKKISARWVVLAREAGCDLNKLDGPASDSGCNPDRLKKEDYNWIEKQAPGHLMEALQWALRRDRILHGQ